MARSASLPRLARAAWRGYCNGLRAAGLECVVYMGDVDMERQELNVLRMRLLAPRVRGVSSGSKTLKDAISEAMRDWVTNVRTTYYLLGSALGAHPYPPWCATSSAASGTKSQKDSRKEGGCRQPALPVWAEDRIHRRILRVHPR